MELLGRYSNLADWAKKLDGLIGMTDLRPQPALHGIIRKLRPDDLDYLVAAFEAGARIHELALRSKIHRATVSLHLHRQGVRKRSLRMGGQ